MSSLSASNVNISSFSSSIAASLLGNASAVLSSVNSNFTSQSDADDLPYPMWIGFIAVTISVIGFGTNYVPVKKFYTGDGLFFQWLLCTAAWIVGLVVNAARGFPPFQPLAMVGGVLFCTGNVMSVPVISMIGMGQGITIWGMTNLLAGWAAGTFGLFGLHAETVPCSPFNYAGAAVAVLTLPLFALVKIDATLPAPDGRAYEAEDEERQSLTHPGAVPPVPVPQRWIDRLSRMQKKVVGVGLALITGLLFGSSFDPPQYLMDHGGPDSGLDYVFSHFSGIFATSTLYFVIYCVINKNQPAVYPKVVLPGLVAGLLWAVAYVSWFVANTYLSLVIAFPLICLGPMIIASLLGALVYKEVVRTRINILVQLGAFAAALVAIAFITVSKVYDCGIEDKL